MCACSNQAEDYSAALYFICFSEENGDIVYQQFISSMILEKDNKVLELYGYSLLDDYYGMASPYLYNEKLYYITNSYNETDLKTRGIIG